MALAQSASPPGPSWDEEVVPALRKRLENESRTLARRMSAISMASMVDDSPLNAFNSNFAANAASVSGLQQNNYSKKNGLGIVHDPSSSGNGYLARPGYQYRQTATQADSAANIGTPGAGTSLHPRVNGIRNPPITTSFHRSRTFSQPYATPNINGGIRQPRRTNTTNLGVHNNLGSRSPRLVDAKPTRIPKASRGPSGTTTNASSPEMLFLTGTSPGVSHSATPTPVQTPNPNHGYTTDIKAYHFPTSHSAQAIPQHTTARLMNEPAPFNTASSSSSIYNIHETDELGYNASRPSRDSVDSMEEKPFEHWYRGEISRNGGVGELRVGRRQEMLDIANYGYAMHNKRKLHANRQAALALEDARRASFRKRAESVAGLGLLGPGLRERGSLYLEDDTVLDRIESVLDEDPLTDLDGEEGSDIASISTKGQQDRRPFKCSNHDTDFIPGVGVITVTTPVAANSSLPSPQSPPALHEVDKPIVETLKQQSTTPTQPSLTTQPASSTTTPTQSQTQADASITTPPLSPPTPTTSPVPRSKSRQSGSSSRIPTYERRSSESRTSAPSQHSSNTTKVGHPVHVVDLSVSPTPSPSPPLSSATTITSPTTRTSAAPSTPTSATKRGASPGAHGAPGSAAKRPRTPGSTTPAKTKPKSKPAIKKLVKEDNRRSVAQYPTLGGEGEDVDMSDAIPHWTQPKIMGGDGNWDDVVLPVIARKKGLEKHYEKADGSPQPKRKQEAPVAPAPGTFGYDDRKARRKGKDIQMDEFGRPQSVTSSTPDVLEEIEPSQLLEEPPIPEEEKGASKTEVSVAHDNIRVPIKSPPSPAPFSHYAPTTTKHLTQPVAVGTVKNEQQIALEQDEKGAGCCRCIIM